MDLETLIGAGYVILTGDVTPLAILTFTVIILVVGVPLSILTALGVSAPTMGPNDKGPGPKALSKEVAWIVATIVWLCANGGVWLAFHYAEHYYRPGFSYFLANAICAFMFFGISFGTVSHNRYHVDLEDCFYTSPWSIRAVAWIARLGEYRLRMVCYLLLLVLFFGFAVSDEPDMHTCGVWLVLAWVAFLAIWWVAKVATDRRRYDASLALAGRRVRWTRSS